MAYLAPSTIGIDTIVQSHGRIPEGFLRGCGVPESFIEYIPALIGAMQPIQFYSCFISYSATDEAFAKRLYSAMRDQNLRVWFADEDLKGGRTLHEQIDEAIRVYDKVVLVLSPESLRSKWVMREVRRTRHAELASGRRKFFPIRLLDYRALDTWECLDPETGADLAAEIREYFIPDFRRWKEHDAFEHSFAQLLAGLKAVSAPPAPRFEPSVPADPQTQQRRRLAILEAQQGAMGILTPPYITMEIEDLRRQLGDGGAAPAP
ncbi:toll/interleukin-1 receptor domain-containing protein [Kouleothrix sp.]|uniref:toll/interleukin-1 receptor domain-containing protein n=1 Tax=Kouleothrix sp. TaxID=2779161 RepID=UPI00391C65C1